MRGESVTMMLEPNYCLQHRDLWDLVTSRDGSIGNMKMERGESGHTSIHPHRGDREGQTFLTFPFIHASCLQSAGNTLYSQVMFQIASQ